MKTSLFACFLVITSASTMAQSGLDDPLLQEPATARGQLEAARLMIGLERDDLARQHLRKVLEAGLSTADVRQLIQEFGLPVFLQMSHDRDLRPESQELLKLINTASGTAPSEAELDRFVADLEGGGNTAINASLALERFGARSVPALLRSSNAAAVALLTNRAYIFRDGLTAALPFSDPNSRIRILRAMSVTGDRQMADFILRDAYSPESSAEVRGTALLAIERLSNQHVPITSADSAAEHLLRKSRGLLTLADRQATAARSGKLAGDAMLDESIADIASITNSETTEAAQWSPDANSITVTQIPHYEATLLLARRYSDDALAIRPGDKAAEAVARAATLAQALSPLGWSATPPSLSDTTATDLTDAAVVGLQTNNAAATFGALTLLANDGTAIVPQYVLRGALMDRDPRVRLRGALTLTANPRSFNTGSDSDALTVLRAMSRMTDAPLAVIIDQNRSRGGRMGVLMAHLGYHCLPTANGIAGFDQATTSGDCAAVLVNAGCIHWSLSPTIANLKKAPQTSDIPILIYGEEFQRESVESLAARYDRVAFLPESFTDEAFAARLNQLNLPAPRLTADERTAMRQDARNRLAELSEETTLGAE